MIININKNVLFFLCIIHSISCVNVIFSANRSEKLTVAVVPGMESGDLSWSVQDRMPGKAITIPVPSPECVIDFGQYFCQRYLTTTLKKIKEPYCIDASSQGTATTLNYISKNPHDKNLQAVFLTGALGSGNSGIYHTVRNLMPALSFITNLPGSYYFLPYIAKLRPTYWMYSPSGEQALDAVEKIHNSNIPIVLAHGIGDPQVSCNDTRALYYKLIENGNKNVYLITPNTEDHIFVLNNSTLTPVTHCILQHHQLMHFPTITYDEKNQQYTATTNSSSTSSVITLSDYQPDHKQYKHYYEELRFKEDVHKIIGHGITLGTVVILTALAKKYYTKYLKKPLAKDFQPNV